MTFKDLKKRLSLEATTQQQLRLNERLQNKPFWIWDKQQHKLEDVRTDGNCCFNHIIFDSLVTQNGNKHIWINKATGLGVSEFMLRYMAWLCLKDNALSDSQMCIVTGPRIDLAIALIELWRIFDIVMYKDHIFYRIFLFII